MDAKDCLLNIEFVGGPFCGKTFVVRTGEMLPKTITYEDMYYQLQYRLVDEDLGSGDEDTYVMDRNPS